MTPERYLDAILSPLEGSPQDAARRLGAAIATLADEARTGFHFYVRRAPTPVIARTPNLVNEHPQQAWVRYPGEEIAFVITSLKGHGELGELDYHSVYLNTVKAGFDIFDSDYLIDPYEAQDAFVFILGTPEFLQRAKDAGLAWTEPGT